MLEKAGSPHFEEREPVANDEHLALLQRSAAGCSSRNIYREKVTGTQGRPARACTDVAPPRPGDMVTVTQIDRLARSTFHLFGIVKRIVDAKAQFRSLGEPWADTGASIGRLMLAVLGGLRMWSAT
jgi:DNA invertase Pin-like site-specific DNA recombinase